MYVIHSHITSHSNVVGRKTKNGDVVSSSKRRWMLSLYVSYPFYCIHRAVKISPTNFFSPLRQFIFSNKISLGIHTISFSQKSCNLGLVGIFDEHKDDHLIKSFSSVPENMRIPVEGKAMTWLSFRLSLSIHEFRYFILNDIHIVE